MSSALPHRPGYIAAWIRGDIDRFKQLQERVGHVTGQLDRLLDAARTASVRTGRETKTAGRAR